MDKQTRTPREVEYVEAEPIGEEAAPALRPMPHVQTHYQASGGCVPCCGPIGCASLLLVLLAFFGTSDFTRPLIYGLGIFVVVSALGGIFARRRRG